MNWNNTRNLFLLAGGLCLLPSLAHGQDASQYLKLCRVNGVASGKSTPTAEAKAYELLGSITGIAESSETYNVLLKTDDGVTQTLSGSGSKPGFVVNSRVRVLIRNDQTTNGTPTLPILGMALEGDVATLQLSQQPRSKLAKSSRPSNVPSDFRRTRKIRARSVPLTSRHLGKVRVPVSSDGVLAAYTKAIRYFNPRASEEELETIASSVLHFSVKYQVDARLVMAIFAVESGFNPRATSRSGAMGLGQLMPGTASGLGVRNAYDPVQNVEGAVKYIRAQLDLYQGQDEWTRLQLALASYNAGPGAVRKFNGVPPYRETQAYIRRVSAWFLHFLGEKP